LGFVLSQLWRDSTKAHGALEADCWCGAVLADEAALAVDRGNIAAVTAKAIVLIIRRVLRPMGLR
jgi:hypothetical protein